MRPIYWGVICFFIGMVGWVFFSVIVGVGTAFGGQVSSGLWALVYLFGIAFYFSLPVAIVAEVMKWYRGRRTSKTPTPRIDRASSTGTMASCDTCGRQVLPDASYCDHCGTRRSIELSHESPTEATRPVSSSRGITTKGLIVGIVIGLVIGLLISVPLGPRYASSPQQTVYVTEHITKQVAPTTQPTTTGTQFDVIIKYAEKYSNQLESMQPNAGYTFLVLTLQIENNADREFSTSTLYFHVVINNIKYMVDGATAFLPDALQYVLLQKGGTISGSIVFQVPIGTTSYTPVYEELFASGQPSVNWVHA